MKSSRSITIDGKFINDYNLSILPPPSNSLFWKMWNTGKEIASNTLKTNFIQYIKSGTLNPVTYGSFSVSNAYYCFKGAQDYLLAEKKTSNQTLSAFLLKKYKSYQKYNEIFEKVWRIKHPESITPTDCCKQYADFLFDVSSYEEPIYTLVVMIPCEFLWSWIGAQLYPPSPGNLYASWINDNNSTDSAYAMGNFLDDYQKKYPIDEVLATELYLKAMNYEYQNFNTAV